MEILEKQCLECGRVVKGRIDKKFCTDYCRNIYNNRQNSDQNNLVRNINNVLRKNRRILGHILPGNEDTIKVNKDKLMHAGFNFKYYTHQYKNVKDQIYYFVYEYGYLFLDEDWLLIVKNNRN